MMLKNFRQSNKRFVGGLLLWSIALSVAAQSKITIEFPDENTREIWIDVKMPEGTKPATTEASGKKAELPMDTALPNSKVFVWDRSSGNLAQKDVKSILGTWKVLPAEYNLVGLVKVQVSER